MITAGTPLVAEATPPPVAYPQRPSARVPFPSLGMAFAYGTNIVIPTGAARSEAQWRDLSCCAVSKTRSLGYAALWAAPLGMTVIFATCECPALAGQRSSNKE